MNLSGLQGMPGTSTLAMPTGGMTGAPAASREVDPPLAVQSTFVSFIDSAVPRNLMGMRFEAVYNNRQPMRSEYHHPTGGIPGATGFPRPETRVDTLDWTSFAEYSMMPWLSMFMEAPYRWLNPEVNENRNGPGDMRYGLKVCTWSSDDLVATFLLRLYQPTAMRESLGTAHWSVEPGLLMAYRLNDKIHLEGEFRWWVPIGGGEFAGDLLRYGIGVSYGQKNPYGAAWFVPVAEAVGWSILSGKTMIATTPDNFVVEDARGQTIVNTYLGVRFGYGPNMDFYAGYGRPVTGHFWQRDIYRFEIRFCY